MATGFESIPELRGMSPEELEKRYKRALFEARIRCEDNAPTASTTIWCCIAGLVAGIAMHPDSIMIGGIWAGVVGAAGTIARTLYLRHVLNKTTLKILREQLVPEGMPSLQIDSANAPAQVEAAMTTLLDDARSGDACAAAMLAMLIHLYKDVAQRMGITAQYQWLLSQSLQTKDPELLACVGEELVKGKLLARDAKSAHKAFRRADELSGFMGAYALGRLAAATHPDFAIRKLRRARMAGHLPSAVLEHRLRSKRLPLAGFLLRWWFAVVDTCRLYAAVAAKDRRRLWRAGDYLRGAKGTSAWAVVIGGSERGYPFTRIDTFVPAKADPDNRESVAQLVQS